MAQYQAPYPSQPEQPYGGHTAKVAPPAVKNAVKLIWVNAALSVISGLLSLLLIDDIIEAADPNGTLDQDTVRAGIIVGVVIALLIGVGFAALFAIFIGKGANWARIVWTVFAVIGLVSSLFGITDQPALLLVLSVISLAITVGILVLLYKPESNAYFKS